MPYIVWEHLARHSEEIGAIVVYCVPPYCYPLDEQAQVEYYRTPAVSVAIPVYLYDSDDVPCLSRAGKVCTKYHS